MRKILCILILTFIFDSCKQSEIAPVIPLPTAEINISGGQYGQFDFAAYTTNVNSYAWDFGDGSTSIQPNITHKFAYNTSYSVKLTVTGAGGKAVSTKTVKVVDVRGDVTFWMSSGSNSVDVKLDGLPIGSITSNYSSIPNCSSNGTAWMVLQTEGIHTFTAKENRLVLPRSWSGTVTIVGGQCSKQQLTL